MGYYSEMAIDTRTCGQADEDDYLDRRDGYRPMTRTRVYAQLEAQRWQAQQASRPAVTPEAQAQDIARRMIDANNDGDLETARRLALELRPLLLWLPEEAN